MIQFNKLKTYNYVKTLTVSKVIISIIALLLLSFFISSIIIRPSIYSDPAWGFLTMNSMLNGTEFNYSIAPDPSNISKDLTSFNGVWTPGQYILPYLLIKSFNLNIGWSVIITTLLMSLSGLVGYFKLFRYLQLPETICWTSILIISSQRFFSLPFSIYNGGEIMLFGGLPWLILYSLKMRELKYWQLLLLIPLGLLGFFLKSSFLVTFYAICICIFYLNFQRQHFKNEITYKFLKIVFVILATTWICHYFFISRGIYNNPVNNFDFNLKGSLFALSSGIASALSLDDMFNRVFEFPESSFSTHTSHIFSLFYYAIISIISLLVCIRIHRSSKFQLYKIVLFSFSLCFLIIFLIFYNREHPISSMEMRHFRPFGLLVIPALVLFISERGRVYKFPLLLLITVSCLYGPLSFIQRKITTYNHGVIGNQGFTQELIDAQSLALIYKIDKAADENTLFYITSPDIALEIEHARVIATQADFENIEELKKKKYFGSVKDLYILLPKQFEINSKETIILQSFVDYKKIIKSKISKQYYLYKLSKS